MNTSIRSKIRPFRHFATYDTGWAKDQTFDDIYAVLAPYAVKLFRKYKQYDNEIPDLLQRGFMKFWEMLVADPTMLEKMTKTNAVSIILNKSNLGLESKRQERYDSLEKFTTETLEYDEYTLTGLEADRDERWAAWATDTDYRIDIERIMTRLALKYENRPKYLFALYAVTTQVLIYDVAAVLGVNDKNYGITYIKRVREEVQREFAAIYDVPKPWIEKYRAGHVQPAKKLLARFEHMPVMVAAIQSLLDEQSPKEVALRKRLNHELLKAYRVRARRELATVYA